MYRLRNCKKCGNVISYNSYFKAYDCDKCGRRWLEEDFEEKIVIGEIKMRTMKWFIFNSEHHPLCWGGKALEFDTEQDAKNFLDSLPLVGYEHVLEEKFSIKECIFYYDDGYLNASGKVMEYDETGEEILVDIKEVNKMKLEILQKEMVSAMKSGNMERKSVISNAIAAIKKTAIDKRMKDNITEELVNEVLLKEQKTLQEMVDTCPKERVDLLEEYQNKLTILSEFVPQLITDETEIEQMIKDIVNNEFSFEKSNKGKIMKMIAPALKGKVDMKVVNKVIGAMLV